MVKQPNNGGGLSASSVYIAVAHTRDFAGSVVRSMCGVASSYGLVPNFVEGQAIDTARNTLAEDALEEGAEHILFWDSDMAPHPSSLQRLLDRNVDIVSGLSFGRAYPHFPIDYNDETGDLDVVGVLQYVQEHADILLKGGFHGAVLPKVELKPQPLVGMAFTLIKMDVFEAIPRPWFSFPVPNDGRGEDRVFCQRALASGYKSWLDWSVVVGHGYGDQYISANDFVSYVAYKEATINAIPN